MFQRINRIVLVAVVIAATASAWAVEKAPKEVIALVDSELVSFATDPVIVRAVKAENAKRKSLAAIRELDKRWQETPGVSDDMQALMDSECGRHLIEIQQSRPFYAEIFVMDNQGANVAMTDKTSDYWQGDEDKFSQSFKAGPGAAHISDVEFDDSSQTYVVQVSLPIVDGDQAIGAITFGIDIDALLQE